MYCSLAVRRETLCTCVGVAIGQVCGCISPGLGTAGGGCCGGAGEAYVCSLATLGSVSYCLSPHVFPFHFDLREWKLFVEGTLRATGIRRLGEREGDLVMVGGAPSAARYVLVACAHVFWRAAVWR